MSADELAELAFIHKQANLAGSLYEEKFKGYITRDDARK